MPNRQQRRHPAPTVPLPVPELLRRLPQPEVAGELSVAEVTELKSRSEEQAYVAAQATHYNRLNGIVRNERAAFSRNLCNAKGLSPTDEFNFDLDSGTILRVATMVPAEFEELPPALAAVPEGNGEQPSPPDRGDDDIERSQGFEKE